LRLLQQKAALILAYLNAIYRALISDFLKIVLGTNLRLDMGNAVALYFKDLRT
jgi:hypothetical protein